MIKLAIAMLGFLLSSSAISANWVVINTDTLNNIYSVDTSTIHNVQTILPTTGTVRSAWIKLDLSEERNGASYLLVEEYFKCNKFKEAMNTLVSYNSDGQIITSSYNISGTSVDFAEFKPVIPDSVAAANLQTICALTAY